MILLTFVPSDIQSRLRAWAPEGATAAGATAARRRDATQSIAQALERATPGTTIVVDPASTARR